MPHAFYRCTFRDSRVVPGMYTTAKSNGKIWGTLEQHSLSLAIEIQKQLTSLILLSSKFPNSTSFLNYFNRANIKQAEITSLQFSSVQSLHVSDSLRPHELQHTRPPCPSATPGVHSNSCPWSWWCHPAISSSVIPFSSCPQSVPALGSFPMSQLFTWGGQSIGVSALASVLPMNTQDWSPLECYRW